MQKNIINVEESPLKYALLKGSHVSVITDKNENRIYVYIKGAYTCRINK